MDKRKFFNAFFSLKPNDIRQTVIISPIIYPKQFEKILGQPAKHSKSILSYLVANFKQITFIKTPMTQAATADLIVLLKNTKCKKIYFIGAIGGLAKELKIGDVVMANKPSYIKSLSSIHDETKKNMLALRKKGKIGIDFENESFFKAAKQAKLKPVACYVVTDLPLTRPFYLKKPVKQQQKITSSLKEIICGILNMLIQ